MKVALCTLLLATSCVTDAPEPKTFCYFEGRFELSTPCPTLCEWQCGNSADLECAPEPRECVASCSTERSEWAEPCVRAAYDQWLCLVKDRTEMQCSSSGLAASVSDACTAETERAATSCGTSRPLDLHFTIREAGADAVMVVDDAATPPFVEAGGD